MRPFRWIASLVLVFGVGLGAAAAQSSGDDFGPFWTSFQQAVEAGDSAAVAAITRFPLVVNGASDGDEPRNVAPDAFAGALETWLGQESGLSLTPQTMREAVIETGAEAVLARGPNRRTRGRAVRFGSFFFERQGAAWRLVRVYEER